MLIGTGSYPTRLTGLALLLMRAQASASVMLQASSIEHKTMLFHIVICPPIFMMAFGFLTRPAAAVACLFLIIVAGYAGEFRSDIAVQSLGCLALLVAGAGAYSIDAMLFGRRSISLRDFRRTGAGSLSPVPNDGPPRRSDHEPS